MYTRAGADGMLAPPLNDGSVDGSARGSFGTVPRDSLRMGAAELITRRGVLSDLAAAVVAGKVVFDPPRPVDDTVGHVGMFACSLGVWLVGGSGLCDVIITLGLPRNAGRGICPFSPIAIAFTAMRSITAGARAEALPMERRRFLLPADDALAVCVLSTGCGTGLSVRATSTFNPLEVAAAVILAVAPSELCLFMLTSAAGSGACPLGSDTSATRFATVAIGVCMWPGCVPHVGIEFLRALFWPGLLVWPVAHII